MSLSMQKMNLFAQNLSNSQTDGYKKKTYAVHSFEDMLVELPDVNKVSRYPQKLPIAPGSYIDNAGIKQTQGRLKQSSDPLDLAIMGEKLYFRLETKPVYGKDNKLVPGQPTTYTISRNGNFMLDKDAYLVNTQGDYLLDTNNKRIRLTADPTRANLPPNPNRIDAPMDPGKIYIDNNGYIRDNTAPAGSPERARIKIVKWTENGDIPQKFVLDPAAAPEVPKAELQRTLKKYGLALPDDHRLLNPAMDTVNNVRGTFEQQGPRRGLPIAIQPGQPTPMEADIKQGYVESSNVDITQEMIMLMMTSKDFDMSQKLIAAEDKVLDKTINEMGRLQ